MGLVSDALQKLRAERARAEIANDPLVKEALRLFEAEIEENGGSPPSLPGWKDVQHQKDDYDDQYN